MMTTNLNEKAWENAEPEGDASEAGGETMESLLAQQAATVDKLADKKVAWVKVITVTKDAVLVDVGEKNEGAIPLVEFVEDLVAPKAPAPAAGQRVPVIKTGGRDKAGHVVLSHLKAKTELGWEMAIKAHAEKQRVRGTVKSAVKGGFIVDVQGVQAFLPASLADLRPVRQPEKMIGTGVRCLVIEVNQGKRQLVLSRKAVLEEEAGKRKTKIMEELRGGEVRIGRIVRVSADGLLVDIGGVEGTVRPADQAWPGQKASFERGQKLKVKVLSKPEKAGDPVWLGIKQLQPNPADGLRKKYTPKSTVTGKITEVNAQGVRFQIDPKTVAYAPAHECDPDVIYNLGDSATGIVTGVDSTLLEVRVSLVRFNEIKDRKRVAQYMKAPPPLTLGQILSPEDEG